MDQQLGVAQVDGSRQAVQVNIGAEIDTLSPNAVVGNGIRTGKPFGPVQGRWTRLLEFPCSLMIPVPA